VKLLVDNCLWPGAVKELRERGFDVSWVGEWDADPGDVAILERCIAERYEAELLAGALIIVEEKRTRVRFLDS
jgi:hypothetical protein